MCIRDRQEAYRTGSMAAMKTDYQRIKKLKFWFSINTTFWNLLSLLKKNYFCLLYTSDAADERSSVDLGGRRLIKKKK